MVYIGGVLVLTIYTILRSSNWKFPPIIIYLMVIFPLFIFIGDLSSYSFFSGVSLGLIPAAILFLLLVLLGGLLLLVKLIKN